MATSKQRRRVIKLMAASVAACAAPQAAMAMVPESSFHQWHGYALGAEVSLQLYHNDARASRRIIEKSVQIIREMEAVFSLYQQNSTLAILNRDGVIDNPPAEFVDLLQTANHISQMTSGAFDITVQPLWQYYKSRYSDQDMKKSSFNNDLSDILNLIDYNKINISSDKISFQKEGMAATLNGIAQGYITDRVSEYLQGQGLTSVLVDIGEYCALGPQANKSPWRIGLSDPLNFGKFSHILEITQGAVATSSGIGDIFDKKGYFHHLFDPQTGKSAHRYTSVTVTAPKATLADALSTAFYAMSVEDIKNCLQGRPAVNVRLTDHAGTVIII